MADTRYELRLRTCPWCGDEVQEDPEGRLWTPLPDYGIHAHTLEQVIAYGRQVREQNILREEAELAAAAAATQQRRLDGVLRTAVEQQRLERRRQRAARRTPPPPPQVIELFGDETL